MTDDQWRPITEEELRELGPLTIIPAPVAPEPEPSAVSPPTPMAATPWPVNPAAHTPRQRPNREIVPTTEGRKWPAEDLPVNPVEDWDFFNYLLHTYQSMSIDHAAQAAGITVYDALVMLEKRNPYFYQIAVLRGPQGGYVPPSRRPYRIKSRYGSDLHSLPTTQYYERRKATETSAIERGAAGHVAAGGGQPGKPTEEEARARFLALLGGRSEHERPDGGSDKSRAWFYQQPGGEKHIEAMAKKVKKRQRKKTARKPVRKRTSKGKKKKKTARKKNNTA